MEHRSIEIKRRVSFYDLDPLHIVWHGNYIKYFDDARSALFENLGIDLHEFYIKTNYLFPIIKTTTKHIFPLRHRDEFITKATVIDAKYKLVMEFEIRLASNGTLCAKGKSEQVAVINSEDSGEFKMALAIPADIAKVFGF